MLHKGKIVGVDVDGVIANLHYRWIELYNQDYGDGLCLEDLKSWDADKWNLKPECGNKIYDYLRRQDLYDKVPVIAGARRGVTVLKELGYRVVYVTSNARGMTEPKWTWLESHGFLPVRVTHSDLIIAHDKSLINVDVLIDDKLWNVQSFPRRAILFDSPWNRHNPDGTTAAVAERAFSWFDVVGLLR